MAKLTILQHPDPRLRLTARPVEKIDRAIRTLAADMLDTMYAHLGAGLAATQVNVQQRIIVMDLSTGQDAPEVLINPELTDPSSRCAMDEGCLSVPNRVARVWRARRVTCRYLNLEGEMQEDVAQGFRAVCLQHEVDHLNGRLFIDHLAPHKRAPARALP